MNGNSNIPMKLSAHAVGRHLLPRSRMVFIALLVVLMIGSVSQTSPAQAAPDDPADVYFEVWAFPQNPPPLCINQELKIYVSVNKGIVKMINNEAFDLPRGAVTGVNVHGSMTNNIGTLTEPDLSGEFISLVQASADFLFTANKVGKTTLTFSADVPGAWTGSVKSTLLGTTYPAKKAEIQVKVIPCKFKVKTVLSFNPGIYNITVISDEAVMTRDEAGTFTGSASMHWVYSNFSIPCSVSAADSSVDLTGNIDDDGGQFVGSETFGPATPVGCGGSGGGAISPLQFKVASSGGVSTSTATASPLSGSATIIVVPEEDKAVAFIPGSHEASWYDFSSLLGTLLALH